MAAGAKLPGSGVLVGGNHAKLDSGNATIECRPNSKIPVNTSFAGPERPPVIIAQQLFATKGVD